MCGIAGILRVTPPPEKAGQDVPAPWRGVDGIPEAWLDTLDAAIAHRGPDGSGRFRDSAVRPDGTRVEVALVHRRLSIIDHAAGAQPMVSERGKVLPGGYRHEGLVAVVFNGCIYNHRELRAELEKAGREFVTDHSDTEVLIHGWREWASEPDLPDGESLGDSVIDHLEGMFAVAIWDRERCHLALMRDQDGQKPLYVRVLDEHGSLAFCSTPGSLHTLTESKSHSLERLGLFDWVSLGAMDWRTPRRRVWQPQQGTNGWLLDLQDPAVTHAAQPDWFTCTGRVLIGYPLVAAIYLALSPLILWKLCTDGLTPVPKGRRGEWEGGTWKSHTGPFTHQVLDEILNRSVCARLEADVPLGCFLSGGIDSSLIAHYAKQARPDLMTLCMRMPDPRYDESRQAEAVARHLGTNHVTLDVEASAADDLVHLITQLGLPFADSSLLPTYWLCKAARRHVKVALSGDGGDELFMGYQRHAAARWLPWLRPIAWAWPLSGYDESDPTSRGAKMARLIRAARGKGYTDLVAIFPSELRRKIFRASARPRGAECERSRFLGRGQARRFDLEHYLPADLLRKTDTASMSVGLEVRCPFLDQNVAAFAMSTPIRTLMRGNTPKALLRELAARHLPPEIVNRPKQGFAIPIGEWFRTDFGGLRTLLMDVLNSREPFGEAGSVLDLDMHAVRGMVEEHMAGTRDHGQRLYALMVLGVWARQLRDID